MQSTLKRSHWLPTILLILSAWAGAANAAVLVTRLGDQDGFGIGVGNGDTFISTDLTAPTALGTDDWVYGGFSAQLTSSWGAPLTSASLQVFSGGWGLDGQAEVVLNGSSVGLLTDGDSGSGDINHAFLDSFSIDTALLTGSDRVEIRTVNPGDGGVLGFIKLTVLTQDVGGGGNNVPEPTSILLVGAALAAGLAARRLRVSSRTAASGVDTWRLPQHTEPGGWCVCSV